MNSHLVAVEVRVECGTYKRMDLDRFTLDKNGFERLNSESMQSRRAIQQHRMFANHFFQNIPDNGFLPFDHFARLLDGGGVILFFKLVVNKRLEKFERHLFGQAALMKFE